MAPAAAGNEELLRESVAVIAAHTRAIAIDIEQFEHFPSRPKAAEGRRIAAASRCSLQRRRRRAAAVFPLKRGAGKRLPKIGRVVRKHGVDARGTHFPRAVLDVAVELAARP